MEEQVEQPRTKVLKNGAVYDLDRGRIVSNPGGGTTAITPERSRELKRMRAEKTAALLRKRITEATAKISALEIKSTAEAVAEAGGMLWEEIVLAEPGTKGVYPRDRVEAFEKLAEMAEMTTKNKRESEEKNSGATEFMNAAAEILRELRLAIQPREVINGTATDIRNENGD